MNYGWIYRIEDRHGDLAGIGAKCDGPVSVLYLSVVKRCGPINRASLASLPRRVSTGGV
jgi:hypothetical protein